MLDYLTKNFIAISAAATVLLGVCGLVFIDAYLATFDLALVSFVESSDILGFGVKFSVYFAFLSYLAIYITVLCLNFIRQLIDFLRRGASVLGAIPLYKIIDKWLPDSDLRILRMVYQTIAPLGAALALIYYSNDHTEKNRFQLPFILSISVLLICSVAYATVRAFEKYQEKKLGILEIGTFALSIFVFSAGCGVTAGLIVQNYITNTYELELKDNYVDSLSELRLVIFLSHHAVFSQNDKLFIFSTQEIKAIKSRESKAIKLLASE